VRHRNARLPIKVLKEARVRRQIGRSTPDAADQSAVESAWVGNFAVHQLKKAEGHERYDRKRGNDHEHDLHRISSCHYGRLFGVRSALSGKQDHGHWSPINAGFWSYSYRVCAYESREGLVISKGNLGEAGAHPTIWTGWLENSTDGRASNRKLGRSPQTKRFPRSSCFRPYGPTSS
jgi:hypothetical protein